jgi:hypothetical protein
MQGMWRLGAGSESRGFPVSESTQNHAMHDEDRQVSWRSRFSLQR